MTKKHFIALADLVKTARTGVCHDHACAFNEGSKCDCEVQSDARPYNPFKQEHIDFLADYCERMNPNFNRSRWLAYIAGECGPNGGAR